MKKISIVFILVVFAIIAGCAHPVEYNAPDTQSFNETIKVSRLRVEVVDRTAGQSLTPRKIKLIKENIIESIGAKYTQVEIITEDGEQGDAILRVYIDVFTAGNRAVRFWVGFGAGKAHMKIMAQWLEGDAAEVKGSREYQKFGALSLRSGGSIENQMAILIGRYSTEFASEHL